MILIKFWSFFNSIRSKIFTFMTSIKAIPRDLKLIKDVIIFWEAAIPPGTVGKLALN
jgi:hypothetical protein